MGARAASAAEALRWCSSATDGGVGQREALEHRIGNLGECPSDGEDGDSMIPERLSFRFCWRNRQSGIIFGRTRHVVARAFPRRPRTRLPNYNLSMARQGVPLRALVLKVRRDVSRDAWADARQLAFGETPV